MQNRELRLAAAIILMLPLFGIGTQRTAGAGLPTPLQPLVSAKHKGDRHWRDPYIGEWSNGRGDRLIINMSTIRFASERAVAYHDVTRVTNGREFHLEITADVKLNYLTRFLHVSFGEGERIDQMKVSLYSSRKDMEAGENSQGEATWYRDK
jgi:hypothetical protein